MKIHIEIDCAPEEARSFFGLPDVQPMQATLMAELEKQLRGTMEQMDPETMMRIWMPVGTQGLEQAQKMFWSQFTGSAGGADDTDPDRK